MKIKGRRISGGYAEGEALVSREPVSFYGGVNPRTGVVIERNHTMEGKSLKGKVFVFPTGKGSTVGSYVIYQMKKLEVAPAAIINHETDSIIATGCILAGIPLMDKLESNPMNTIRNGDLIKVKADEGLIEIN